VKTKRANKEYECKWCWRPIQKGEQYARRSVSMGQQGVPSSDGIVRNWQPYRVSLPICNDCAQQPGRERDPRPAGQASQQ
jgi:hypothetical protein